jgi:2-oxo-4-hydroxy-4-carboxy-5-ureidoimidazoline decarboxylase
MIPLQDLNGLDRAAFAAALDGIFEHPPWIAERAWERRPFADLHRLHQALDDLTPEEIARFERDNARYWERFGFPFVICVRENKKQAILAGFERRLQHDPVAEQRNALDEISKIGWYRLKDRIRKSPAHPVDTDEYGRTHHPRA